MKKGLDRGVACVGTLDWVWVVVITLEEGTVDRGLAVWVGTLDWSQWVEVITLDRGLGVDWSVR